MKTRFVKDVKIKSQDASIAYWEKIAVQLYSAWDSQMKLYRKAMLLIEDGHASYEQLKPYEMYEYAEKLIEKKRNVVNIIEAMHKLEGRKFDRNTMPY